MHLSASVRRRKVLEQALHRPRIMGVTASRGTIWLNAGDLIGVDARTGRIVNRTHVADRVDANAGIAALGDRVCLSEPGEDRLVGVFV
jgi:hypothetical protein